MVTLRILIAGILLLPVSLQDTGLLPGDLVAEPDFVELYYPRKQYVQLSGVCNQVLQVSLSSALSSKLNVSTLPSMEGHFRGLFLSSRGSSKQFITKLMSFMDDKSNTGVVLSPALSFDKSKNLFVCNKPVVANCKVAVSTPYNTSLTLDADSDWYGTSKFTARFLMGSGDSSIFMCSAPKGKRKPLTLFINTLPTLSELTASIDEATNEVTVRCSGLMSSVFTAVYLWELLIVSPGGSSYRLDNWAKVAYSIDKPEPGLTSATLTAVLPVSRIPVASVTFHCQILNILGQKYTERLLPFVLESLMQLPTNIKVEAEKLRPIDVLGTMPIPAPPMMPLSTFYRLRCKFDSVAPQLVRVVWDSYFFNPRQARYIGKRHNLDHPFILLNETLYNNGHHLCRVWLKNMEPSTSICSEPIPAPRRSSPLCKDIAADTNETSLLTDLIAFVPLGEDVDGEPTRDLIVQSMTTALILLSCVSGVFFLCLIMMIGRFHCRLRREGKKDSKSHKMPLLPTTTLTSDENMTRRPSLTRRNSFPRDGRSETFDSQGLATITNPSVFQEESSKSAPRSARSVTAERPARLDLNKPKVPMSSVACEADLDDEEELPSNVSQVPLLSSTMNDGNNFTVVVSNPAGSDSTSPPFAQPDNGKSSGPLETPAPEIN